MTNANSMVTCIEDIPIEIWLLIFSYLEAHDIFYAFTNLNNYFQQLINSHHLFYNVQFNKNDYSSLISILYCSSSSILDRIISLEWIAKPQYGYLPQFINRNISKFIRLRSLKIAIHSRQTYLICKILPELHSLENVSIKSENIQTLISETVFALPSLHFCELISSNSMSNVECVLNGQSNIEILYLTNVSIGVQLTMNSFFDYLPNLKKLEICGSLKTFKHLNFWISNEILMLNKIPIIKIKCNSNRTTLVFFEQIQSVISVIKCFSLRIYIDIQDEILLERLINDWWSFIQQIKKIHISIRISKQINQAQDHIQNKFTIYQNMFLSKNDQSNEYCQIKWTQTDCPVYRFIAEMSTVE
jgi:hypothetical protein